jgi:chromosome segregation ATPase
MGENENIKALEALIAEANAVIAPKPVTANGNKSPKLLEDPQQALTSVVSVLESTITDINGKLSQSKSDLESVTSELERSTQRIEALEAERDQLIASHEKALAAATASSSSEKNAAIEKLTKNHSNALKQKNANFAQQREALENRIADVEGQLSTAQAANAELLAERVKLAAQIEGYKSALTKASKKITELTAKVKNYNQSYKALQSQITTIYNRYKNESGGVKSSNQIVAQLSPPVKEAAAPGAEAKGGAKKRVTRKRKSVSKKKETKPKSKKQTKRKSKRKSVKKN